MASLKDLLKFSRDDSSLSTWQLGVISALEFFLVQIKKALGQEELTLAPVMISYVVDENSVVDIENAARLLHYCFEQVGVTAKLWPLVDAQTLEAQLLQTTYAVVLCTPAYAKQVEQEPAIRQILDNLGKTKKNALQPLLCEGSFPDVALKIVDGHYLIRSYQSVLLKDHLTALPNFIDVIFNLSGNQGLALLPDVLDLKEIVNAQAEAFYRETFQTLQQLQQQLTTDYRLNKALEESVENHPLKDYLDPETLPVVKETSDTQPTLGFKPIIDELSQSSAKVGLLFCQTKADVELTSLALTYLLMTKNARVLSIECAEYPGKAASDCVRLALQKMKLKPADIEAMKKEPLIILLKGYENIGAYDNLWVKNKLSTWSSVKLIVTCRADFFKFRGYLSCFLADVSNRKIEEVSVYKVSTFASLDAQKASLSINHNTQAFEATDVALLGPKRSAEYIELTHFLKKLNHLWVKEGYLKSDLSQNSQFFISYAWEADKAALARQQIYLSRISHDLTTLGFRAWLDIERMSGDIDEQMAGNIANSQGVLVIETPRYIERSQKATNVKKEYDAIIHKSQQQADFKVLPIQFLPGVVGSSFELHRNRCNFMEIDDDYLDRMMHPDYGLVSRILLDTQQKKELYQNVYTDFRNNLQLLIGKHLVVNQGLDDVLAYDMDNRLKGYIAPYGLYKQDSPLDTRFDLVKHFDGILNNPKRKAAIVLGSAGSGKSLFALSTFKAFLEPWQQYQNIEAEQLPPMERPIWLPIYIQLRNYSQQPEHVIEQALKHQFNLSQNDIAALKQGLNHKQQILFILDGYDELGSGVRPKLTQSLHDWSFAKVLITARPEHFDKDHRPLDVLTLLSADEKIIFNSAEEIYVSPFSPDEIERYVGNYEKGKSTDTYSTLKKLPGMMGLLDNPFLLTLVLQSLPQFLMHRQTANNRTVVRADIYQAFTETWFLQETKGRDLNSKDCEAFNQALAFRFFAAKTNSVSDISTKQDLWTFFNQKENQAAQDASPLRFSGGEYSFVHKSVYEYFVATRLWKVISESDCITLWQTRLLTEERAIIHFLAELYRTQDPSDKAAYLIELLEKSRDKDFPEIAASNAITVLNAAKVSLSGKNLSNIRIPSADLNGAILDNTNFEGANLTGVTLTGAWLHETNFKNACMTGVELGEFPSLLFTDCISDCCYSPNGRMFAVAYGSNMELYDVNTRQLIRKFNGYLYDLNSIDFSPDGKYLAAGGENNTATIYSIQTGEVIWKFKHKNDFKSEESEIWNLQFSADGKYLATGGWQSAKMWSIETGNLMQTFVPAFENPSFVTVKFSPDSKYLVTRNIYETWIWSIENDTVLKKINTYSFKAGTQFSPNGKYLITGESLWVVESGALFKKFSCGHCVCFSPDGKYFVTGHESGVVELWSVKTGQLLQTLEGHTSSVRRVHFNPDGKSLMTGSRDGTLRFWSIEITDNLLSLLESSSSPTRGTIRSMRISLNGKRLLTNVGYYKAEVWSPQTGDLLLTLKNTAYEMSPDGMLLAMIHGKKSVQILSTETGEVLQTIITIESLDYVKFNLDGTCLLVGCFNKAQLFSLNTSKLLQEFRINYWGMGVRRQLFVPDGKRLMVTSGALIQVWSLENGNLLKSFKAYKSKKFVQYLHVSPDGNYLVTSNSDDNSFKLWLIETSHLIQKAQGHTRHITAVEFTPDGKQIVSASEDNTLRVWSHFATPAETNSDITKVSSSPTAIAMYKNTKDIFLITGHQDHSIRCWQLIDHNNKPRLQLLWSTQQQRALLSQGACIEGVQGLSQNNIALFIQRGAVENTLMFSNAGKKASGASSSRTNNPDYDNKNDKDKDKDKDKHHAGKKCIIS